MQYFSSSQSNLIAAPRPKNPSLPPQITKHYIQQEISNNFMCRYCMTTFVLNSGRSIQQMIWHTQSSHQKVANTSTKRYTLQQKMDNLKPPPKYLNKYEHMDIISDRWLDRLIIDGYPVSQIMQNVFHRLTADSDLFLLSCERRAKILHHAQPHIIAYLPHLPLHFLPDQSIHHLSKKFKINYEGAGLLLKRHGWSFQKGLRMYYKMRQLDIGVKVLREGFNDTVVVFANARMKYLYNLYGDSVNLQYRFVPLKRSHSGMHYNIGLFLGQDPALRVILFGVALINGYCTKNVKASIAMFLEVMKHRCPQTIITDHSKTILDSIQQLQSQLKLPFKHMINWHYCTEKLKVELANQPDYRQCIKRLTSALSAITKSQYDFIIRQLKNSGRIGYQRLSQFEALSQKCCFSGTNPRFVGFGVQQDRILGVTKQVQNSFFYMNRVGLFYSLAFRLQNKWNSIAELFLNKTSSYSHPVAEIEHLSKKLSRQVFSKLLSLYTHSLTNLEILFKHEAKPFYKVRDKSKSSEIGQYYVHYDFQSNCWRCNCLLIYWSGLPCQHLIKIVRFFKGSLAYYINQRWRITSDWGVIPAFQADENDNSQWVKQNQNFDKLARQTLKTYNKVKPNINEKVEDLKKITNTSRSTMMEQEKKIETNQINPLALVKMQM